jgi:hypothetical protein
MDVAVANAAVEHIDCDIAGPRRAPVELPGDKRAATFKGGVGEGRVLHGLPLVGALHLTKYVNSLNNFTKHVNCNVRFNSAF